MMARNFAMSAVWGILLQKSKIERYRKSREADFLAASTAATLCSADTMVRGRFCAKQCGPSRRHVRSASPVLENFARHPKRTFSTLSGEERTFRRSTAKSAFDPNSDMAGQLCCDAQDTPIR